MFRKWHWKHMNLVQMHYMSLCSSLSAFFCLCCLPVGLSDCLSVFLCAGEVVLRNMMLLKSNSFTLLLLLLLLKWIPFTPCSTTTETASRRTSRSTCRSPSYLEALRAENISRGQHSSSRGQQTRRLFAKPRHVLAAGLYDAVAKTRHMVADMNPELWKISVSQELD